MKLNISEEKFKALSDEQREILKANFSFHSDTKCWHSKEGIATADAFEISKVVGVYPTVTWSPTKERYKRLTKSQQDDIKGVMKYNPKTTVWESKQNFGAQATYILRAIGERPSIDFDGALQQKLMKGISEIKTSEQYINYLDAMSKFIPYSPQNQILIALQAPYAEQILSRSRWWKDFQRSITPNAKGILILAPNIKKMPDATKEQKEQLKAGLISEQDIPTKDVLIGFKPIRVYDVSETQGKAIPESPAKKLDNKVADFNLLKTAMIKAAEPYKVSFVSQTELKKANGMCNFATKEIKVSAELSESQTIKTLLHEVAHSVMHSRDAELGTKRVDKQTRELQAESTAYMICSRYGLDTSEYTFGYMTMWSSDKEPEAIYQAMENSGAAAKSISRRIEIAIQQLQVQELEVKHSQEIT